MRRCKYNQRRKLIQSDSSNLGFNGMLQGDNRDRLFSTCWNLGSGYRSISMPALEQGSPRVPAGSRIQTEKSSQAAGWTVTTFQRPYFQYVPGLKRGTNGKNPTTKWMTFYVDFVVIRFRTKAMRDQRNAKCSALLTESPIIYPNIWRGVGGQLSKVASLSPTTEREQ